MENLKGQLKIHENGATSLYIYDENGYIAEGNNREKVEELVNKFNGSIQLKNINLKEISKNEQLKKVKEEFREFTDSMCDYMVDKTEENKNHFIEEYFDLVQSALGLLDKFGVPAKEVMKYYSLHEEKIKNRPREKKCSKCICCNTEEMWCEQDNSKTYEDYAKECKCYEEAED
jgi:phosphoribosyl-ATP pyrophosphohydrolase